MKRVLVPTVAAAAAVLVLAVVNASAGHTKAQHHNPGHLNKGGTIRVVERATTDAVTNGSGDSAGNILTFANDVFDSANANKVGSDQGSCVRIVAGKYRNVRGSMDLKYRNPAGTEFDFIFHLIG